jgi:CHAD domain-containing protein
VADIQREREDKFDVGLDFAIPELGPKIVGDGRTEHSTVALTSTYYDTPDRALLRQHVTLRRREGDTDMGWQMKVPAGAARTEIRLPLYDSDAVPAELSGLVAGLSFGEKLAPVAILKSRREITRLYAENGDELLEIADDIVHATTLGDTATVLQWREVEIELGTGDEKLLSKVGRRFVNAGARPSDHSSKLARALGSAERHLAGLDTVRGVVTAYLAEQFDALSAGDVSLRRGLDAIHPTRVATRRLRSTLRVFGAMFDSGAAQSLDSELAWYAELLGAVRDPQVQRPRFADAVKALPAELVLGPVASNIDQYLLSAQLRGREELMHALDSDRYLAMLKSVDQWVAAAPFTAWADGSAKNVRPFVKKAVRKATKRLEVALVVPDDDKLLHQARKSAKRARYANELAAPVLGAKAARAIGRYKAIQDTLGEHQDSVVAAELLRRLGAQAGSRGGENGFTYGILFANEKEAGKAAREAAKAFLG